MTDYTLRQIPEDFWKQVKAAAALEGISIKQYIIYALQEKMDREKQERGE